MIQSPLLSSFGLLAIVFCAPLVADELSPRSGNPIYGGAIEFLYAQPAQSTNKRFSDFRDTDFDGASYRSSEPIIRGRVDAGDGSGLEGRIFGEFTYLEADARRSYPGGKLQLQHRYMGFNAGGGGTWILTPMIALYAEASILLPLKNEVRLSSGVGDVRYKSDYDDGSRFLLSGLTYGTAIGIDARIYESWILILHYDFWQMGSGKAGSLHAGVGYAL